MARQPGIRVRVTTTLYRAYDAADRLLYVGITDKHPSVRLVQHTAWGSSWRTRAVRFSYEEYSSRESAAAAELSAIRDEEPVFNLAGRPEQRSTQCQVAYEMGKHPDDVTHEDIEQSRREFNRRIWEFTTRARKAAAL